MKILLKYLFRIVAISALYHLNTFFDPSFETSFLLPGTREKVGFLGFNIYGLLIWRLGEIVFNAFEKRWFSKISPGKRTPYLVLLFFFYGIFVSLSFVASYYIVDFMFFYNGGEWPGGIPFFMVEFNLGVFQYYLMLMIPLGYQYYHRNLQKERILNEQLKKENIQSKYEVLKNQIDPHFFFNSLSVLTTLVYKDADESAEYVTQLSKLYRYMLDKNNSSLVELEKELKFLDSYIYLMKIRFKERLSFSINISDTTKTNSYIPPNTLQLLVENAIKHNKFSSEKPLNIEISESHENIRVSNNLDNRMQIAESSGIGLENIKLRYELLGGKHIQIQESPNQFIVTLPKFNITDYENIDI